MLDRRVRPRITDDCTLQDFRRYLTEEWQRIPQRAIDKVVRSMRGRVNEVLLSIFLFFHLTFSF